jgi:hypothetical protein
MTRQVLFCSLFLYGGLIVFALACQSLSPYPGVINEQYDAGQAMPPGSGSGTGSGTGDAEATEDATEDADGEPSDTTAPPACPTPSTLFATADFPQTITLNTSNVYWTNAPFTFEDGGARVLLPTGSVSSLTRGSTGTAKSIASALTGPIFVTNGSGYVGFTVLGAGVGAGGVDLFGESASTLTSPGMSLQAPGGVAIDSSNVYWVSDSAAGIVVESAPLKGGAATTIGIAAGSYLASSLSVKSGNLYFAAQNLSTLSGGAIFSVTTTASTPVPLQQFSTGSPSGVTTDNTNVYWSDIGTGGIYSMPLGGGAITTIASGLGEPYYLAIDSSNLYTAEGMEGAIYEIPISGGSPKKLATGVPNETASIAADGNEALVYFGTKNAICTVAK